MEGFDTGTMTYMASTFDVPETTASDVYQNMMMPPNDFVDQYSNYDAHTFPGDEYYAMPPQTTPSLKRFSSTYDDAYSDAVGAFDNALETGTQDAQDTHDAKEIAIEQGHKFLKFTPPELEYVLLDYDFRQVPLTLGADLLGLFFTDKTSWAKQTEDAELMCYRRNIFQVSGTVLLPRGLRYIMTGQAKQIPIISQELVISATESSEGSTCKIICVPWKTPPTANQPVDDKAEKEPSPVSLDLNSATEGDANIASFGFHWKRLQFRSATANNGRRKELQQHFLVHLKVIATLATGGKVTICHTKCNPIVVRGRSPRNFQSRKDILLTGNGTQTKKPSSTTPRQRRPSMAEPSRKLSRNCGTMTKMEPPASAPFEVTEFQVPPFYDSSIQHGAMTALPPEPQILDPRDYAISSPDFSRQPVQAPQAKPQKLSLTDEDELKPTYATTPKGGNPNRRSVPPMRRPSSFALQVAGSPDESADLLYEYFPLTLDDWQPPVDAVYRPHVVHHTNPLPENKSRDRLSRMKSKRYFSEDVG